MGRSSEIVQLVPENRAWLWMEESLMLSDGANEADGSSSVRYTALTEASLPLQQASGRTLRACNVPPLQRSPALPAGMSTLRSPYDAPDRRRSAQPEAGAVGTHFPPTLEQLFGCTLLTWVMAVQWTSAGTRLHVCMHMKRTAACVEQRARSQYPSVALTKTHPLHKAHEVEKKKKGIAKSPA